MKYLYIILCILLVGCSNQVENTSDYVSEDDNSSKLIYNLTNLNYTVFISNGSSLSSAILEYSLFNLSELTYRNNTVTWVYQIERNIDDNRIEIIPCIVIEDGTRYCTK